MNLSYVHKYRWRFVFAALAVLLVVGMLPVLTMVTHAKNAPPKQNFAFTYHGRNYSMLANTAKPPTDAYCRAHYGFPCYSPQEMHKAYGLDNLINHGYDGKGQTIIIIDSFGSPTIKHDLKVFDAGYGLPDPPSFKVYSPLGTKPFDPSNGTMVGWAVETTLDVEWAHAMAPGAGIALMTSPVAETQGVGGMPQFLFLEQWALDHNLGHIISQSWATTENTLFGYPGGTQVLKSFDAFYKQAAADNVTVFASSGDSGVANPNVKGKIYPFPTVNFPASDPWVTAVGGTTLTASTTGKYQNEVVWSGASGGGVSEYFKEPDYERDNLNSSNQGILNGYRGLPDIAYNADPGSPILIYLSFLGKANAGYSTIGGTSEGSPQWAGLAADANQLAGHPLGFLNESLYELGNSDKYAAAYHDITVGNNSADGITGYNATTGWDPTTGWGSPVATTLFIDIILMQQK